MGAKVAFSFAEGLSERKKEQLLRSFEAKPDVKAAFFLKANGLSQSNAAPRHKAGLVEFNRDSGVETLVEKVGATQGIAFACRA